jgi:chromosome segregation ATPase
VANSLELAKSQLKGHLSDRNADIRKLKGELEQARELQTDHGLIQLYKAGTAMISKQADELKNLKVELQRGKAEHDRLKPKLVEKDNQISKVENEKKICREAMRKLQDRLTGMQLNSPDVQANSSQEVAAMKQRLEDFNKTVDGLKRQVNQLKQENERLVMALGRQHFNELDLP